MSLSLLLFMNLSTIYLLESRYLCQLDQSVALYQPPLSQPRLPRLRDEDPLTTRKRGVYPSEVPAGDWGFSEYLQCRGADILCLCGSDSVRIRFGVLEGCRGGIGRTCVRLLQKG